MCCSFILVAFVITASRCTTAVYCDTTLLTTENKDPRCHMLINPDCDVSLYRILDYREAGWFYHVPFKSCRPFYAPSNGSLCPQNRDLPFSREQCENICGEQCVLANGQIGLCQFDNFCDARMPASYDPRPCAAYNVVCCPENSRKL